MSESVKNLISAIATGDAVGTENAFNATMAEKISAKLDDMRITVAQGMFKTAVETEETPAAEITDETPAPVAHPLVLRCHSPTHSTLTSTPTRH